MQFAANAKGCGLYLRAFLTRLDRKFRTHANGHLAPVPRNALGLVMPDYNRGFMYRNGKDLSFFPGPRAEREL